MPVRHGRRHAAIMVFAAAIMALASATAVGFLALPKSDPNENTASVRDPYRMATITRDTGSVKCIRATFDNVKGQISRSNAFCDTTATAARPQAPGPLGTIHTLNAISSSFR
jgi:hypothetical protein